MNETAGLWNDSILKSAHRVKKIWGEEAWLVHEKEYTCKLLKLNAGFQCSLHFHPIKQETFIVTRGVVLLEHKDEKIVLFPGQKRLILPKEPHRFGSATGAIILEISTHHDDADVVRLEESRKLP